MGKIMKGGLGGWGGYHSGSSDAGFFAFLGVVWCMVALVLYVSYKLLNYIYYYILDKTKKGKEMHRNSLEAEKARIEAKLSKLK